MSEQALQELYLQLRQRGYPARQVAVEHARELQAEFEERHEQGLFDEEFYQECLTGFSFAPPAELPGARSLIVAAIPRPQTQAIFNWRGQRQALIIPPTYTHYRETTQAWLDLVAGLLAPFGYHAARSGLPLKLLAVRSGLASYGRNNITYVPGLGSFLQLVAAYTDLECVEDSWGEARMMERCHDCKACRRHCPTGAIPSDRFLLRTERCLVYHTEREASIPFPSWIDPSWHNCLIGCMRCQQACPEDRDFLSWVEETEEFSEEETALLLEGVSGEKLPPETAAKLERIDVLRFVDLVPRNVGAILLRQPLP
jgi:epoxyqueuosine reductase